MGVGRSPTKRRSERGAGQLDEGVILRLFAFRPLGSGAAFDAALRDAVLPDLLAIDGVRDAYVGRHGPDENGERVIASVWASRLQMAAHLGESSDIGRFHAELVHDFTSSRLDVLPIHVAVSTERPEPPRILRVFRGEVREGETEAYLEEARAGTLSDAAMNEGLVALYLGVEWPSRFVTVSAWTGWAAIEEATGGNTRQPLATRNAERLVAFDVGHYEILPNSLRPGAHPGAERS
jgi:hypothetical protein